MKTWWRILGIGWKESLRSAIWHRKALVNALLIFMFIYLASSLALLGVVLDDVLIKLPFDEITYRQFKESFVLRRLNQFLLYYFFGDFLLRYFMQKLPALSIQPLLHLPIKKSTMVHLMLSRSVLSPFNLWHFIVLGPFVFELFDNLPTAQAMGWTFGMGALIMANNFWLLLLKRTSDVDTRVYVALILGFISLIAIDWFELIDTLQVSMNLFNQLFIHPWTAVAPLILAAVAYWINHRYLRANMYLQKLRSNKRSEYAYTGGGVLSRFGKIGLLSEMEFKFIWRNKRPRSVLLLTVLFLGYGLLVFPNEEFQGSYLVYVLFSIIITGMFMMNYGQYLLGWDGSHFDHVLTRGVSFEDYYMGKFVMMTIVSATSMILSTPYAYFGMEVLLVLFAVFLYNVGINAHVTMFFGSFNPKKIDLTNATVFNWQGVGASQFIFIFPVMGLPVGLFGLGAWIWGPMGGSIFLGTIGILGILGTKYWIALLAKWLRSQRYQISTDFRDQ